MTTAAGTGTSVRAKTGAAARSVLRDAAFDDVEAAFSLMARKAGLPRLHERFSAAAGVDLEPSSFQLIRRLELAEPIRMSDLAALMGLDLSTVSRQVALLEAAGLVGRSRDPLDGRASLLTLNERGRIASSRICASRRSLFAEFLSDWPKEDVELFAALLTRFAHAMAAFAERGPGDGREPSAEGGTP
jgi:DNA-binding MarR family transcriptional regulator